MNFKSLPISISVFFLTVLAVFFYPNFATADDCIPTKVSIPGNQISGHIELSEGQNVSAVAEFSGNCAGRRAEFRICYQTGSGCEAVENSAILGNQPITGQKATIQWKAQKNPLNAERTQSIGARELSGSILRQSLPIQVLAASEETECRLRGLSVDNKSGQISLGLSTNARCENETVLFFACTQDNRGVQACNINLGQAKVKNNKAALTAPLPSSLKEVTKIFFRASYKLQNIDSSSISNTSDLTFAPIGSISLNFTGFKFKIDNPLAGKAENLIDLLAILANFIFQLGVPVAVIIIIYSGILFLVSADKPAVVQKATNGLKYAAIGLAVLLIGKGFVSLIQSLLSIK